MIVHSDGQFLLRSILSDDVLIKESLDLGRLGKMYVSGRRLIVLIFIDNVLTHADTLVTDEDSGPRDQFSNVILTLITE